MNFKEVISKYFKYIVLVVLLYMPIFGHLDALTIQIWDESRVAINAYEMSKNGDFLVPTFDGSPDMWNTKPPLLVWIQVAFMKVIGVNELSVRLPSAFATFFTCIALLLFLLRYIKQFWFGFIAVIVLITSWGYVSNHGTRTGDYDALLTFFTTISSLLFFAFVETKKNKFLYLFFIATALAVLTKSIAGLLFVPAMVIYIIWQKQFLNLLKNKHFYFGLAYFLFLTLGYYFLREMKNPGYIDTVMKNEFGGRYLDVIESHKHGFWYYYDNFIEFQLSAWYLLVPLGLIVGLLYINPKINRITLFSSLMVLTFLIVISISKTKLVWYDVPMYPFLAILIAVFLFFIFEQIKNFQWINKTLKKNVLPFVFLYMVAITPYQRIVNKTYLPQKTPWVNDYYEMTHYLKEAVKGYQNIDNYVLAIDGYCAQNKFYVNLLNEKNAKITFKYWVYLANGDKVIAYQKKVKDYITINYNFKIISENGNITKYDIIERKQLN